ncbi:MAG: hypothetical protein AAFX92_03905 [Pseudomonadota bacterium]
MEWALSRISNYNILNYLLPGVVFAVVADQTTSISFIQGNIIVGLLFYYFIGMAISRLGSLVIEPALKKLRIVRFSSYRDYVQVAESDKKLDVLSEQNNLYRTMSSGFLVLTAMVVAEAAWPRLSTDPAGLIYILLFSVFLLLLFSYVKQTDYVVQRVEAGTKTAVRADSPTADKG